MELLDGIETRRSIRGFKPTPIPEEIVGKILKAVSNSPSYTNTQPWEVVMVSGKKKDELSKILYELASAKAATNPDLPIITEGRIGLRHMFTRSAKYKNFRISTPSK